MKGTIRRTDKEWSRLSAEMHQSGQTRKAWCIQHGINIHSYKDWEYRQKKKAGAKANNAEISQIIPAGWIAVESPELSNPAKQTSFPSSKTDAIEVRIGSCAVKVWPDFDDFLLTRVCQVLLKLC
jgi:hypothetical protein